MSLIETFMDLDSWKKARVVCKKIYEITSDGRFERDFALKDQIRRSSISIMANIAEGFERGTSAQKLYFMNIAIGSAGETRSHLILASDLGYIKPSQQKEFDEELVHTIKLIVGFMKSQRNR